MLQVGPDLFVGRLANFSLQTLPTADFDPRWRYQQVIHQCLCFVVEFADDGPVTTFIDGGPGILGKPQQHCEAGNLKTVTHQLFKEDVDYISRNLAGLGERAA